MNKEEQIKKIRIATTTLIEGKSKENILMDINDATEIIKDYSKHPEYLEFDGSDLIVMLLKQILKASKMIEIKNLEIYNRNKGMKLISKQLEEFKTTLDKTVKDSKRKIKASELFEEEMDELEFSEKELDDFVDAVAEALGTK